MLFESYETLSDENKSVLYMSQTTLPWQFVQTNYLKWGSGGLYFFTIFLLFFQRYDNLSNVKLSGMKVFDLTDI